MPFDPEIIQRLQKLEQKYEAMGQDLKSYLDGLLYANYPTYWDYINLDTLLTLQTTKTDFPDELIFVIYHQITELYFKLSLHELEQICHNGRLVLPNGDDKGWRDELEVEYFIDRVRRINQYFEALTKSFDIMVKGMEKMQFLRFRMALLPASGFQSAQYRKIEICATDFIRLVDKKERKRFEGKDDETSIAEMFSHIYWKQGATEIATKRKTLTLSQFEEKYTEELIEMGEAYRDINLWQKYLGMPAKDRKNKDLINALRQLDVNVNVNWPLVHYKSAVRYLHMSPEDLAATGGTNWQKYLPPKFQRRIFYPELWSDEEIKNWGKGWVDSVIKEAKGENN